MKRVIVNVFLILALLLAFSSAAFAQEEGADRSEGRQLPESVAGFKLENPVEVGDVSSDVLERSLLSAKGSTRVIVRLSADSAAEAEASGRSMLSAEADVLAQQDGFLNRVSKVDPNARLLGEVQLVLNAVFLEVGADALPTLAEDPAVERITRVVDYEMDLFETVPYIGAAAAQAAGYDGTGVRVAVLDSGIDYYHAALGGSGDPADYAADDPTIIEPGTFPTAKVVGGYDFVGSDWPDAEEALDPDPLDDGPEAGHGTHVAHIIAGGVEQATNDIYKGVAPGVELYAVKVCSSVSTACSGVALIQGMEFAVDPNGDGNPSDAVDVINMSLGSTYGQPFDDDLAAAVDNATALGVLTVASAGNGGDKPYVNGTPSSATTALSVAETNVPSAILPLMEVIAPAGIAGLYQAVFQPWSAPLTSVIEAPLQYGDGAGGNLDGCAPFTDSLAGFVVLVDRGACNFSLKISNISVAGGEAGIIGLVAPGDPFSGGDGGDRPIDIPGYMISQADSDALKSGLPDTAVRFDPAVGIPLIGAMVGSSSRGPQHEATTLIKPEIGAPGASISAIAGSGISTGPFGGTSGAAPMVSGSAALLLQKYPFLSPAEVKARLMNNGDTDIVNDAVTEALAPITRIGGGEVRVEPALTAPAAAWDNETLQGALSFGFFDADRQNQTLYKQVRVRNYTEKPIRYNVTSTFRFEDDELNGAVSLNAPRRIWVPAHGDRVIGVQLNIQGSKLPGNFMNSGSMGADGAALTANEYDGYLILDDGMHPIHMAWHVLPRKAARLHRSDHSYKDEDGNSVFDLFNRGVGTAQNDAYALLAYSPDQPEGGRGEQSPTPDIHGVGINTFPVPAGFCSAEESFVWAFAINTWERQEHLLPVSHQFWLDTDQDGVDDYVVLNRDVTFSGVSDGRQLSWALDLVTGSASAFFFAEHAMNTGNTVLYICGEQVGLTGTDMLSTNVDMDVVAQDWYYGGLGDFIGDLTVTPLGERYLGVPEDIGPQSGGTMTVLDFGPFPGNSKELGVMLFSNGDRGDGARGGATWYSEVRWFVNP